MLLLQKRRGSSRPAFQEDRSLILQGKTQELGKSLVWQRVDIESTLKTRLLISGVLRFALRTNPVKAGKRIL